MHSLSGQDHRGCLVAMTAVDERDDLQPREHAEAGRLDTGWNGGRRNILLTEGKEHAGTWRNMQEQGMLD